MTAEQWKKHMQAYRWNTSGRLKTYRLTLILSLILLFVCVPFVYALINYSCRAIDTNALVVLGAWLVTALIIVIYTWRKIVDFFRSYKYAEELIMKGDSYD